MAKFLNTSATHYYLDETIRLARDQLILLSPVLKLNDQIKELLEDKNRLNVEVQIVYEKNELRPAEVNWLRALPAIRTSYSNNLHARCCLNEQFGVIASLNLYQFNQANTTEMGILISRLEEPELFQNAFEEARRIVRGSEEVRMSFEKVHRSGEREPPQVEPEVVEGGAKFSTSKLARQMGLKTQELTDHLIYLGAIEVHEGHKQLTPLGRRLGGELRVSARFGPYFLWPKALPLQKKE